MEQQMKAHGSSGAVTSAFDQFISGSQAPFGRRRPGDLVGQTIDGKYQLDAELGVGGMGAVYRAKRLLIGDTVAIKIILPEYVSDQKSVQRFRREAQATALLKHPNAVAIHDFGTTSEGLVYLVMELVEGHSLRQIIKEQGRLSPQAASVVINQVCAALDEAHRRNIIHRDLKPDNIIVTTTTGGVLVKVLDFGLAKLLDPETTASNLTQPGTVMGTPLYMSPEQFLGEALDSRSDIYSLGVVLYEMLTGAVPFSSPTPTAVVVQHVNQAPPPLREKDASIPPAVEAVVLRALEKRREARQQTALALAQDLSAAIKGETTYHQASPASTPGGTVASGQAMSAGTRETVPTMLLNTHPSGGEMFSRGPEMQTGAPSILGSGTLQSNAGKRLLPIIVAVVFILALSVGGLAWWLKTTTSADQTQGTDKSKQASQGTQNGEGLQANQPETADSQIKSLSERRHNATDSELTQVMDALERAEKNYPGDYRFPYERAKVAFTLVKGDHHHHKVFELLNLAGQRAIDNGKSVEMLNKLSEDEASDFRRLRGHDEWNAVKAALTKKDKTLLREDSH